MKVGFIPKLSARRTAWKGLVDGWSSPRLGARGRFMIGIIVIYPVSEGTLHTRPYKRTFPPPPRARGPAHPSRAIAVLRQPLQRDRKKISPLPRYAAPR